MITGVALVAGAVAVASFAVKPDKTQAFDLFYGSVFLNDERAPVAVDLTNASPTVRLVDANTEVSATKASDLNVVPLTNGTLLLNTATGEFNVVDATGFVIKSKDGGVPHLGVPARLVTGFRLRSAHGGLSVAPGSYDVTTADAWTWVEIPIRGSGWVVVDPAPRSFSEAQRTPTAGAQPSQTPTATPTRNALITQSNGGHAVAPKSAVPHQHAAAKRPLIIALLIGFAGLAALVLLVLVLRKRLRARRRRRVTDPRRRLLGAWHESLDLLAELNRGWRTSARSPTAR